MSSKYFGWILNLKLKIKPKQQQKRAMATTEDDFNVSMFIVWRDWVVGDLGIMILTPGII
jgi:hypothetical protein